MKLIIAVFVALLIGGCAAHPQLPLQFATLRLIERGSVEAQDVIDKSQEIHQLILLSESVTLFSLDAKVRELVGYDNLEASSKLIVDVMVSDVTYGIDMDVPITEAHRDLILERVQWIKSAAAMY